VGDLGQAVTEVVGVDGGAKAESIPRSLLRRTREQAKPALSRYPGGLAFPSFVACRQAAPAAVRLASPEAHRTTWPRPPLTTS